MSYLMTDCCDLTLWFCVLLQDDSDLAKTQIKHKMSATKIQSFEFSRDGLSKTEVIQKFQVRKTALPTWIKNKQKI